MAAQAVIEHGGDLAGAEARFGRPAAGWVDLSTGINPWPWPWPAPLPVLPPSAWSTLPGRDQLAALTAAACAGYGFADPALVAAAPGSQALIQALPYLRPPGTVAVVGPTYAEHALCWRRAGHRLALADQPENAAADVLIVVNPNNPDGRSHAPAALLALAQQQAARGGWLVVDEAFAELTPELSLAPAVGRPGLVVLRSFGKFFGLAGLRLGFAGMPAALAATLNERIGPWALSGPALALATPALLDDAWISATRARLAAAAADLDQLLSAAGFHLIGGTTLYRLVAHGDAGAWHERLARAGLLVRRFADQPQWLRFGLPPDAAARERLASVLQAGL